jgi:MFS family permease
LEKPEEPAINNSAKEMKKSPAFFYGYTIIISAFIICFVIYAVQYAFGVFFKPMINEFGWSRALTSGAFSLSWIVQGVMSIVMGKLCDSLGPRIVVTISGFLIGISYILMSQINDSWQFYLLYGVLGGAGISGIVIPLGSTMARWFAKRRNVMTAFGFLGVSVGVLVGSPVSEMLITSYDWRIAYLLLGSIVFIVVILVAQLLRKDPSQKQQVAYGHLQERNVAEHEDKVLTIKEAMKETQFWITFVIFFCLGYVNFGIFVHMVPHATDLGVDSASAAGIMAIMGASSGIGGFAFSVIADKIGNKKVFIVATSVIFLSLIFLLFANSLFMLQAYAVLFSIALGGCCMTQSPLVASIFGLRSHGLVFGALNFGFAIGATLGSLLNGFMYDASGNYHIAFILMAVIGLAGALLAWGLKTNKTKST